MEKRIFWIGNGAYNRAPKMAPKPFWGARKPFGTVFLDYIKHVIALEASLDYTSQPITGKSPEES